MSGPDPDLLAALQRYRPELRYDSLESFFADSAGIITDRPGNVLKRADGTVIAAASPGGGTPQLSLGFLRPQHYANGEAVAQTDYVDEVGTDYVAQAREIRSRPGYSDRVHGRVVVNAGGANWLQYWFFMYYDDPGFLGFGTHEGDLEMIQLRLDSNNQPTAASYSQHKSGVKADYSQLELAQSPDGAVPVTYSARGSHANLLRAGQQFSDLTPIPDHNDGQGHRVRGELIVLTDDGTPWSLWPGIWGGTRASGPLGDVGVESNSPLAPNRHQAWRDPSGFHDACESPPPTLPPPGEIFELDKPVPPAPQIVAQPSADGTAVNFTIPAGAGSQVTHVVAGLFSPDTATPAVTASTEVSGTSGTITLPPVPGGSALEVRATAHAADGTASATQRTPV